MLACDQSACARLTLLEQRPTWRMASLCISWPLQAGIMFFSVANSSFILDLRRRSIRLCAVFLAIFRPAALVALGCFFLELAGAAPVGAALPDSLSLGLLPAGSAGRSWACSLGFIWMILRVRVGGGGRSNWSRGRLTPDWRSGREFAPIAMTSGEVGDVGPEETVESLRLASIAGTVGLRAAGGSEKQSGPSVQGGSLATSSADMEGVRGTRGRDMLTAAPANEDITEPTTSKAGDHQRPGREDEASLKRRRRSSMRADEMEDAECRVLGRGA